MAENPDVDPQTGMAPIMWNSWETVWTGQEINTFTRTRNESTSSRSGGIGLNRTEKRFLDRGMAQRWMQDTSTRRKAHWHRHNRGRFLHNVLRRKGWDNLTKWEKITANAFFTRGVPKRFKIILSLDNGKQ